MQTQNANKYFARLYAVMIALFHTVKRKKKSMRFLFRYVYLLFRYVWNIQLNLSDSFSKMNFQYQDFASMISSDILICTVKLLELLTIQNLIFCFDNANLLTTFRAPNTDGCIRTSSTRSMSCLVSLESHASPNGNGPEDRLLIHSRDARENFW